MQQLLEIRFATEGDVAVILQLINELAEYERLAHEVVNTEEKLKASLFGVRPYAEVLLANWEAEPVGFALFFHNYSTFLGRPGVYLEDLFVRPHARGRGIGKAMMVRLASIAVERGCGRFEWAVLDWNEPSIQFYQKLGAIAKDEWTTQQLSGQALEKLAGKL